MKVRYYSLNHVGGVSPTMTQCSYSFERCHPSPSGVCPGSVSIYQYLQGVFAFLCLILSGERGDHLPTCSSQGSILVAVPPHDECVMSFCNCNHVLSVAAGRYLGVGFGMHSSVVTLAPR